MEEIYKAVEKARSLGMGLENYWLYFKKDGSAIDASQEENKRNSYIGFFVEDDSRLSTIAKVAQRKTKWRGEK
jgi:hypothetical protein